MVIEETRLPLFQHGHALPMNAGRVKQESGAGRAEQFRYSRRIDLIQLAVFYQARMLPAMSAFDVIEGAAANV